MPSVTETSPAPAGAGTPQLSSPYARTDIGPVLRQYIGSPAVQEVLSNAAIQARKISESRWGNTQADTSEQNTGAENSAAMTHSWLITGPPGSGRTIAAKAFAAALECSHPDIVGCGECEQCRSVEAGSHPDVSWVKTDGMTITVNTVRTVVTDAAKMPSVGNWRVVVVEDADRLNESSANALLKSVEEPTKQTVFILCAPSTDPRDIAITLRSRCRHVYVPIPDAQQVEKVLATDTELGLSQAQATWAANVAGGHIGRARYLASSEVAREKRAAALKLPELIYTPAAAYQYSADLVKQATEEAKDSLKDMDAKELQDLEESLGIGAKGRGVAAAQRGSAGQIKELQKNQKNRQARMVLDSLDLALIDIAGLYRDALYVAINAGKENPTPLHPDMHGTAAELAQRQNAQQLLGDIDAVMDTREKLQHGMKPGLALDAMIGAIRQASDLDG